MKWRFLLLVIIFFEIEVNAQNWMPLMQGNKYLYRLSNSSVITNTLWVDSVNETNLNTLYYLNRTGKEVTLGDNEGILYNNIPNFLQKTMKINANGEMWFENPDTFYFPSIFSQSYSWEISPEINATVTGLLKEEIWGQTDSVRKIMLSNGDSITWSMNYGFLCFPAFDSLHHHYILEGITELTQIGQQLTDYHDFFNFEVGNVFMFEKNYWDVGSSSYEWLKVTIIEKQVVDNTYIYLLKNVGQTEFVINYPPNHWSTYRNDTTLHHFFNSPNEISNLLPGMVTDFSIFSLTGNLFPWIDLWYADTILFNNNMNCNGDMEKYYLHLYDHCNGFPDWLQYSLDIEYKRNLGLTKCMRHYFEIDYYEELKGFIKNGDTTGIIYSDDVLLNLQSINKSVLKLFPNPGIGIFHISGLIFGYHNSIKVYDITGNLILSDSNISENINLDLSGLERGLYLIKITSRNDTEVLKLCLE